MAAGGGSVVDEVVSEPAEVRGTPLIVGVVIWLASELMLFAGFFAAYFTLAGANEVWPPADVDLDVTRPAVFTGVFVISALTMWWAMRSARSGRHREMQAWLLVTALLGAAFVASTFFDLRDAGFGIDTHAYGTIYWVTIGVHWLHVIAGICLVGFTLAILGGRTRVASDTTTTVAGYFWWFLVALSLAVFVVFHLVQ